MLTDRWRHSFVDAALSADANLATPALIMARLEHGHVDVDAYEARIDTMADQVRRRLPEDVRSTRTCVTAMANHLFGSLGFTGNELQYQDPRNSFLNDVLDRRTGIPITLSVVYLEVARRAGILAEGVGFPGHFIVRVGPVLGDEPLLVDPFNDGRVLSESNCRELLRQTVGEDVAFDAAYLSPANKVQILQRMLLNLKRLYVGYEWSPHALAVSDLIVAINPMAVDELRDRGLLASHLDDYPRALRDLEAWLQHISRGPADEDTRKESEQVWEHVKGLRKRIAGLN